MNIYKNTLFTFIVIIIEFVLSYLIYKMVNYRLLDIMFFVGVSCCAIFIYFSSYGGFISNTSQAKVATSIEGVKGNFKMKGTSFSLRVNFLVLGSVIFFLGSFIIAFWY
ncbi:hypothetical protein FZW96_11130 [Bacillus sp. BGMRC 2118]|nr:hypothetical protein FZW96_11130 [Bacillus sp. BGMRC 2118]